MIAKITLIAVCALLALVSASGYGYNSGYGSRGYGHGNGYGHGGGGGYGHKDFKYGYDIKQGDYHSKASFNEHRDPYTFNYNVYQTHPYGGHSQIYHTQSHQPSYGYGH